MALTPANYISLKNGRFAETTRDDLDAALQQATADGRRLVIHFHGGLVSRDTGMAGAERLSAVYQAAGAHPLCVVWQSGLLEVIEHNLAEVAGERIFQRLVQRVLQFTLAKARQGEGERGLTLELPGLNEVVDEVERANGTDPFANAPAPSEELTDAERAQIEAELAGDQVIETETAKIVNALHAERSQDAAGERGVMATGSTETLMSPDVLRDLAGDPGVDERSLIATGRLVKAAVAIVARVVARLARGRGHGVYPTVVEEVLRELYLTNVGGLIWEQMKKDTADAFGDDPAVFGGTALVEALARQPDGPNPVLVGHSTGAVYIAHLIDHAAAVLPPDRKFDVVLLAPAIDFELMARMLGTHGDRIERLRVFCMQDKYEQRDRLVSVAYPRSLLYFVSGALEGEADTPIVGMQRFYETDGPFAPGRVGDIDAVRAYLQGPERAVWSIADSPGGLSSSAVSHGDFDNDPVTLASVSQFIANGGGPDGG